MYFGIGLSVVFIASDKKEPRAPVKAGRAIGELCVGNGTSTQPPDLGLILMNLPGIGCEIVHSYG